MRYPMFLKRSQALEFAQIGRKKLERLVDTNIIRVFRTPGDHRRFHRNDLSIYLNEQSNRQVSQRDKNA